MNDAAASVMSDVHGGPTIASEAAYASAYRKLSRASEPPFALKVLMRAFEAYRQARKLGWSRGWNKYGVRTFQAFTLRPDEDAELIRFAGRILEEAGSEVPPAAMTFARELLSDRAGLRGFLFVQDVEDDEGIFEGVTLSLGRRASGRPRYRDRLDIFVEARVTEAGTESAADRTGPDRLRIFVDPFDGARPPLWQASSPVSPESSAAELFEQLALVSAAWAGDESRIWSHWSNRYIDYFGPRQHHVARSHFGSWAPSGGGPADAVAPSSWSGT